MTGYKRFRISADTWPIQKAKEKQSSRNWETQQQEAGKTLFISLPPPTAAAVEVAAAEETAAEEAAATSAAAPSVGVKGDRNWNMKTNKASNPVDGSQLLQQKPSGNSALKREKSPAKGEGQADRHRFRFAKHLNFDFQRHLAASKRTGGKGQHPHLFLLHFTGTWSLPRIFSQLNLWLVPCSSCPCALLPLGLFIDRTQKAPLAKLVLISRAREYNLLFRIWLIICRPANVSDSQTGQQTPVSLLPRTLFSLLPPHALCVAPLFEYFNVILFWTSPALL